MNYKIGQMVVTDLGIGNITSLTAERVEVNITFPAENRNPYRGWLTMSQLRYSFDTKSDYRYLEAMPVKSGSKFKKLEWKLISKLESIYSRLEGWDKEFIQSIKDKKYSVSDAQFKQIIKIIDKYSWRL